MGPGLQQLHATVQCVVCADRRALQQAGTPTLTQTVHTHARCCAEPLSVLDCRLRTLVLDGWAALEQQTLEAVIRTLWLVVRLFSSFLFVQLRTAGCSGSRCGSATRLRRKATIWCALWLRCALCVSVSVCLSVSVSLSAFLFSFVIRVCSVVVYVSSV